ncbi:Nuclear transcription factor Y subunit B-4 [Triticum urartu]|uniref:Nuclear transcription factor Y subunit B-4 n=1 Tax=Triticum urartu TaxID=4572 RepID=M8A5F1_TRIUA|nr:Nuclear transcription factor Y subunit B-4 [Triticum urartu]
MGRDRQLLLITARRGMEIRGRLSPRAVPAGVGCVLLPPVEDDEGEDEDAEAGEGGGGGGVRPLWASNKSVKEKCKIANGDDLIWSMGTLAFEDYVEPLKMHLKLYREL